MKQACHYASRLVSDSLDRTLTLWERIRLKLHLSICNNCRNCDNNFKLMQQINYLMKNNHDGHVCLSDQQRNHLHEALDKHKKMQYSELAK